MTAEVAVLNKIAIALAADSAVTIPGATGPKIYDTVNKIFSLSKYCPVGVMVYGNAEHLGVPWESVVKVYRGKLGSRRFDRLEEYAADFLQFLASDLTLFSREFDKAYVSGFLIWYLRGLVDSVQEQVDQGTDREQAGLAIVQERLRRHESQTNWPSLPDGHVDTVLKENREWIDSAITDALGAWEATAELREGMATLSAHALCKTVRRTSNSGVVVAGFGDAELLPGLCDYTLDGRIVGHLRCIGPRKSVVTLQSTAVIVPFAQSEMVSVFMRGIDPDYRKMIVEFWRKLLGDYPDQLLTELGDAPEPYKARLRDALREFAGEIPKGFDKMLEQYEWERFINPVMDAVAGLPKDELAIVAETLVSLTKFKRRVTSSDLETVAGPVDVAVISKGDGFVWIKRKHYFDQTLNQPFLLRYYQDTTDREASE